MARKTTTRFRIQRNREAYSMHPSDQNKSLPARRRILGSIVSGAALLGLNAAGTAVGEPGPDGARTDAVPEELLGLARLRNYKTRRSSSWDRTGGNGDAVPVEPGQTATLLDVAGAGVVTHLWFT